jgi:hypothetical protein
MCINFMVGGQLSLAGELGAKASLSKPNMI